LIISTEVLIFDKLDYSLHFFHADIIAFFNRRIHDKWAATSIVVVVVIRFQGKVDDRFELIIADGNSSKNVQMACIQKF
jgi:hypothetical protein